MKTMLGVLHVFIDIKDIPGEIIPDLGTADNGKDWKLRPPEPLPTSSIPSDPRAPGALRGPPLP